MTQAQTTKYCRRCEQAKPLSAFNANRSAEDGKHKYCKSCRAAYRANSRKSSAAYAASWRAGNPGYGAAYGAAWRAKNPKYHVEYNAANPHYQWEARYRRRCAQYGFDPVVRRFTAESMTEYWGNGKRCIYCDAPATEIEHLTPVGLGGHHVIENVTWSCGPCNRQNISTVVKARRSLGAA